MEEDAGGQYTDIECALYTNCLLLGFDAHRAQVEFSRGMFRHSNPKGGEAILYFLFSCVRPQQVAKDFHGVWPIFDARQARDFKKVVQSLISDLENVGALPKSNSRISALATCCGERFIEMLWHLSAHALREVYRRTYAEDVAANPLPAPLTSLMWQTSHAPALLGITKGRIALERRRFLEVAAATVQKQSQWISAAEDITQEYRNMRAEEAYLEQEQERLAMNDARCAVGMGGLLVDEKALRIGFWDGANAAGPDEDGEVDMRRLERTHAVMQATELWDSLMNHAERGEQLAAGPLGDIVAWREHRYCIDGSMLRKGQQNRNQSRIMFNDVGGGIGGPVGGREAPGNHLDHRGSVRPSQSGDRSFAGSPRSARCEAGLATKDDTSEDDQTGIVDLVEVVRRWMHPLERLQKHIMRMAKGNNGDGPDLLADTDSSHRDVLRRLLDEHRHHLESLQLLVATVKEELPRSETSIQMLRRDLTKDNAVSGSSEHADSRSSRSSFDTVGSNGASLAGQSLSTILSPRGADVLAMASSAMNSSLRDEDSGKGAGVESEGKLSSIPPTPTAKFLSVPGGKALWQNMGGSANGTTPWSSEKVRGDGGSTAESSGESAPQADGGREDVNALACLRSSLLAEARSSGRRARRWTTDFDGIGGIHDGLQRLRMSTDERSSPATRGLSQSTDNSLRALALEGEDQVYGLDEPGCAGRGRPSVAIAPHRPLEESKQGEESDSSTKLLVENIESNGSQVGPGDGVPKQVDTDAESAGKSSCSGPGMKPPPSMSPVRTNSKANRMGIGSWFRNRPHGKSMTGLGQLRERSESISLSPGGVSDATGSTTGSVIKGAGQVPGYMATPRRSLSSAPSLGSSSVKSSLGGASVKASMSGLSGKGGMSVAPSRTIGGMSVTPSRTIVPYSPGRVSAVQSPGGPRSRRSSGSSVGSSPPGLNGDLRVGIKQDMKSQRRAELHEYYPKKEDYWAASPRRSSSGKPCVAGRSTYLQTTPLTLDSDTVNAFRGEDTGFDLLAPISSLDTSFQCPPDSLR
ncbi:hypothetical protein CBR_g66670 [Chara braunii]|uniref:HAUS augmin-like complex subunit 6 N-terminal domain-containing protein n=1 Tax=Chara braunii TaxID=69332 RepID=A0A388JQ14_CHABU|nr:hypothetical protein CBR_g66670 [Chara braunii]|eukprot:GBG59863.1 hypothetical protein CBR_g66670 [Chara braunii]